MKFFCARCWKISRDWNCRYDFIQKLFRPLRLHQEVWFSSICYFGFRGREIMQEKRIFSKLNTMVTVEEEFSLIGTQYRKIQKYLWKEENIENYRYIKMYESLWKAVRFSCTSIWDVSWNLRSTGTAYITTDKFQINWKKIQ